jgi:hypothetical protein
MQATMVVVSTMCRKSLVVQRCPPVWKTLRLEIAFWKGHLRLLDLRRRNNKQPWSSSCSCMLFSVTVVSEEIAYMYGAVLHGRCGPKLDSEQSLGLQRSPHRLRQL